MSEVTYHSALLTDLYELTMAAAYFENGFRAPVAKLSRLPEPSRRLQKPEVYPIRFSRELEDLLEDLRHGLPQLAGRKGA